MTLPTVTFSGRTVSRFIIGGNQFSGFSHQGVERDAAMMKYFTVERIKATLRDAESRGINTFLGRTDRHITRMLSEYRGEGGTIQWFAQSCPEFDSIERSVTEAESWGATACYIHGGVMDFKFANGQLDDVAGIMTMIRDKGMAAGIAGHNPDVFAWAENAIDVDFYMCSYYNASHRDEKAEHVHGRPEWFLPEDRHAMAVRIAGLSRPVIHYKILAAGRNDPDEAFAFAARHMRPGDAACVGVCPMDDPGMLDTDIALFNKHVGG